MKFFGSLAAALSLGAAAVGNSESFGPSHSRQSVTWGLIVAFIWQCPLSRPGACQLPPSCCLKAQAVCLVAVSPLVKKSGTAAGNVGVWQLEPVRLPLKHPVPGLCGDYRHRCGSQGSPLLEAWRTGLEFLCDGKYFAVATQATSLSLKRLA